MKAQRVTWPALIIQITLLLIHIAGLQIFVFGVGLGFSGIGTAFSVSLSSEFVLTYAFLYLVKDIDKRTIVSFSREDLKNWSEYLKYALSGVALVIVKWWSVEIVFLFITMISEAEFATQTVFSNLYNSIIIIAYGFGTSLN